ncbi:MAG: SRPBCC family protein [Ferrimicrobium sp.]
MDAARETQEIQASESACFGAVADVRAYPLWASDIRSVEVLTEDAEGRPLEVAFRAAAFGRSSCYSLAYDYSDAPHVLRWHQISGDITALLEGSYHFAPAATGSTLVTYEIEAELIVPMPSFLKRRAEVKIVRTALEDLARRVGELERNRGRIAVEDHH